jgi:putative ABC transport system permease protein
MESLRQDTRYALRNLRKTPGFAVVAVVTLGLGIGASTAIFSVLENVLMEPFPYPDAQRYMWLQIHDTDRNDTGGRSGFLGPEFSDYAEQNHVFDRVIANDSLDVLYRSSEGTQLLSGNYVTPGTFEVLVYRATAVSVDDFLLRRRRKRVSIRFTASTENASGS